MLGIRLEMASKKNENQINSKVALKKREVIDLSLKQFFNFKLVLINWEIIYPI